MLLDLHQNTQISGGVKVFIRLISLFLLENLTFQGGKKINVSERIDGRFSDALHWHQYAELLLSRCDGNSVTVDFTSYSLRTNDIVFAAAGSL